MKIKKSDTVKILSGKDKGKTGKVLRILVAKDKKAKNRVVVEGLNLKYKHIRPKRSGEKGQRIMFPYALDISKVALVCPKCGKPSRVIYKLMDGKSEITREKKQRVCKKCKNII